MSRKAPPKRKPQKPGPSDQREKHEEPEPLSEDDEALLDKIWRGVKDGTPSR